MQPTNLQVVSLLIVSAIAVYMVFWLSGGLKK